MGIFTFYLFAINSYLKIKTTFGKSKFVMVNIALL